MLQVELEGLERCVIVRIRIDRLSSLAAHSSCKLGPEAYAAQVQNKQRRRQHRSWSPELGAPEGGLLVLDSGRSAEESLLNLEVATKSEAQQTHS